MKRNAFTMIELISVIVIIGILSSMAIPKFTGIKDQAIKATEISTALAISTALESIHSTWSISDGDFDWNNDGLDDSVDTNLSSAGYPWYMDRNGDDLGALLKSSSKSGFKAQTDLVTDQKMVYRVYTAKASNPNNGVKCPTNVVSRDIEGKPDKNDFWIYAPEVNSSCSISGSNFETKKIISGDFMMIDVNTTTIINYSSDISVNCS